MASACNMDVIECTGVADRDDTSCRIAGYTSSLKRKAPEPHACLARHVPHRMISRFVLDYGMLDVELVGQKPVARLDRFCREERVARPLSFHHCMGLSGCEHTA